MNWPRATKQNDSNSLASDLMPAGLAELLAQARERLSSRSDTPSLDAQLLLMRSLAVPRSWLLAHPEFAPKSSQLDQFNHALDRYLSGVALPHVLGWWEFYGRQLHLNQHVLIPRPETERLVELALSRLAERPDLRRVVDVGTGSGCIVVSLAAEYGDREYTATDIDRNCLEVARLNLTEYGLLSSVGLVEADLLLGVHGPFDLLTANLPYVPTRRLAQLEVATQEPAIALDGGPDGLALLRRLAHVLKRSLRPGGEALFELDPDQMSSAEAELASIFKLDHASRHRDLSGRERALFVRRDPDG
jgi:release factor glutamine methyltransferase